MYSVVFTSHAARELRRLDRQIKNRITATIVDLESNPRPVGCIQVKSEKGLWRIRVGDWRIGYQIIDREELVTIERIAHRSEFYD
jgi:mRNA interferase RelE/StbE